jgi:hypothetical protein
MSTDSIGMENLIKFLENSLSDPNQGVASNAEPMSLLGMLQDESRRPVGS